MYKRYRQTHGNSQPLHAIQYSGWLKINDICDTLQGSALHGFFFLVSHAISNV